MNRILSAFAIAIITVVVFVTAAWASDCIHNDATTGTCQSWNAHCTCSQSGEDNCDGTSRTIYRGTGGQSTCIGGWQGSSSAHYKMVAAGGNCGTPTYQGTAACMWDSALGGKCKCSATITNVTEIEASLVRYHCLICEPSQET